MKRQEDCVDEDDFGIKENDEIFIVLFFLDHKF